MVDPVSSSNTNNRPGDHLSPGGQLLVIGNRQLQYQHSLRRLFPKVEQVSADSRFTIWRASQVI